PVPRAGPACARRGRDRNGGVMTDTARAGSGLRRAVVFGVLVAIALVFVALFAGGSGSSGGPPLSPRSTSANGTQALMLLPQENGAQFDLDAPMPPASTSTVAFILRDQFNESQRTALQRWVNAGGTLVLADPTSPFLPLDTEDILGTSINRGDCNVDALRDVN